MQQLLTPATFEFFARYLLAGYVIIIVRSYFIVGSRPRVSELFVEAIILSLVSQMVFLTITLGLTSFGIPSPLSDRARLLFEALVLPATIGFFVGKSASKGWSSKLFRALAIPTAHPVKRAYDYAFGQQRAPSLVIVSYEDGTIVRGYFGPDSLASSDSERSDLFLERLYSEDEHGQWMEMQPGRSGYVSLKGVRSIEFLDPE